MISGKTLWIYLSAGVANKASFQRKKATAGSLLQGYGLLWNREKQLSKYFSTSAIIDDLQIRP
jgi:hypothetical protein